MSEQKPDPISGPGSTDPGLEALAALATPPPESKPRELKPRELKLRDLKAQTTANKDLLLNSVTIASPKLAPEQGGSAAAAQDASKQAPKVEAVKADAPRPTGSKIPSTMSPLRDDPCDDAYDDSYEGSWSGETAETAPDQDVAASGISGKRRFAAFAAVIGLAVVSGAIGGALATGRLGHHPAQTSGSDETKAASVDSQAIGESIARIDAELASLKQLNGAQSAKVNDRIDKVEKAQAEPTAKLAKLSETVEKLRAAPAAFASAAAPRETTAAAPTSPPAPAPVASTVVPKETTASIQPPTAAAAKPKPKPPETGRLPTVEGWVLRDVTNDGAVIEGRRGLFEVLAGDAMPGLGRVEAIRRQDGRWVVVTTKGLIVAR